MFGLARPDGGKDLHVTGTMLTDVGLVRGHNEDSVAYLKRTPAGGGMLAVIADGMGGHNAGEVASAIAVDTILDVYADRPGDPAEMLAAAFAAANRAIFDRSQDDPACRGMGTTCTVIAVEGDAAFLGHIGDSRAYLLRDGALRQLTTDHSLVNQMFAAGLLTAGEMAGHPDRNIIVKALGTNATAEPDIWREPRRLKDGDVLMLCSDGLVDLVDDGAIARLLAESPPSRACAALRDAALAAGGHDNVSVGVFIVSAEPPPDDPARTTRPMRIPGAGMP